MNLRHENFYLVSNQHGGSARRVARKHVSAEYKVGIVLEGLCGQTSISALCRREGIAERLYYSWSKEFIEAGRRRLAGDLTGVEAMCLEKNLRREVKALKEVVAEQALELRELKKGIVTSEGDKNSRSTS